MVFYRKHWPDVGVGLALGISIATTISMTLSRKKTSRAQVWSAWNLVALLLHQFEEYRFPGYFPGQFNAGVLKSETPDRYPLNTQSAMIINTALAYPVYILPLLFPRQIWLGFAPVFIGFGQVLVHGIVFPLRAKARYGPGFVTALCLHLPCGFAYIRQIKREQLVKRTDWIKGCVSLIVFAAGGIAAPLFLFRDKESPYRFTERQMGPYGHE